MESNFMRRTWNSAHREQKFGSTVSHMCTAEHFLDEDFVRLSAELGEPINWHRKLWEFCTIARVAEVSGMFEGERSAIGFGVGREPLVSFFAGKGIKILASDQPSSNEAEKWDQSAQYCGERLDLWKPTIIDQDLFERNVDFLPIDMNELPEDVGSFDFLWSSCVIEHLGGFEQTMNFLQKSAKFLKPGGMAIHTTEIELSEQREMKDYGYAAVFRDAEIIEFHKEMQRGGLESVFSFYCPLENYQDRWISEPPYDPRFPHLKLRLGESVTTSFVLIFTKNDNETCQQI